MTFSEQVLRRTWPSLSNRLDPSEYLRMTTVRSAPNDVHPHPNPLPEGEGARGIRLGSPDLPHAFSGTHDGGTAPNDRIPPDGADVHRSGGLHRAEGKGGGPRLRRHVP